MLIVDTGVIVAATDRNDRHHARCAELLESEPAPLVTTAMVIAECSYLIARELGAVAEATLYQAIADGTLVVYDLTSADWKRVGELIAAYADLPLGGTDASVIAAAEHFGEARVATLDRRHFSVVRPAHAEAFEIVP